MTLSPPYRYKWTIPVKWHSVTTNKNVTTMFNKSTTGTILSTHVKSYLVYCIYTTTLWAVSCCFGSPTWTFDWQQIWTTHLTLLQAMLLLCVHVIDLTRLVSRFHHCWLRAHHGWTTEGEQWPHGILQSQSWRCLVDRHHCASSEQHTGEALVASTAEEDVRFLWQRKRSDPCWFCTAAMQQCCPSGFNSECSPVWSL